MNGIELDLSGCERAGLVEAYNVYARQPLDGGEFVDEHLAGGELCGADRKGDARHEDEPEGNHRGHGGDRIDGCLNPVATLPGGDPSAEHHHLGVQDEKCHGSDRPADDTQHKVDRRAQLARDEREPLGLSGESVGIRVGTHTDDAREPLSRDDDRTRKCLIAGMLVDSI